MPLLLGITYPDHKLIIPRASDTAITNAHSTLKDPQKRAHYDQFGVDPDAAPSHSHGGGGGGFRSHPDEFSPVDLFEMFFTGTIALVCAVHAMPTPLTGDFVAARTFNTV